MKRRIRPNKLVVDFNYPNGFDMGSRIHVAQLIAVNDARVNVHRNNGGTVKVREEEDFNRRITLSFRNSKTI